MNRKILFVFCAFVACSSGPRILDQPVIDKNKELEEPLSEFEFVSELARKDSAIVQDLLLLTRISLEDNLPEKFDLNSWRQALIEIGWLSENSQLNDKLTYGVTGQLLAGRCLLQGNTFLHLFGPSEKYGLRECQRLGFLDNSFPNQHIPGSVLMTASSMADAHTQIFSESEARNFVRHLNTLTDSLNAHQTKVPEDISDE